MIDNAMLQAIIAVMNDTSVYIPYSDTEENEAVRVDFCDEDYFRCTGEESGDDYTIFYTEVDLVNDTFYELQLLNTSKYLKL